MSLKQCQSTLIRLWKTAITIINGTCVCAHCSESYLPSEKIYATIFHTEMAAFAYIMCRVPGQGPGSMCQQPINFSIGRCKYCTLLKLVQQMSSRFPAYTSPLTMQLCSVCWAWLKALSRVAGDLPRGLGTNSISQASWFSCRQFWTFWSENSRTRYVIGSVYPYYMASNRIGAAIKQWPHTFALRLSSAFVFRVPSLKAGSASYVILPIFPAV